MNALLGVCLSHGWVLHGVPAMGGGYRCVSRLAKGDAEKESGKQQKLPQGDACVAWELMSAPRTKGVPIAGLGGSKDEARGTGSLRKIGDSWSCKLGTKGKTAVRSPIPPRPKVDGQELSSSVGGLERWIRTALCHRHLPVLRHQCRPGVKRWPNHPFPLSEG